ncbi:MAG: hypothetical protein DRQ89_14165 [Epsilonproteobacteria bacterium]|nr:MAG: hypothetical protein DRQ89_14165 [Campylobacterota bacterium]
MSEHTTTVELNKEIPLRVCFDYTPEELKTLTYPGCDSDAEISEITLRDYETDLASYFTEVTIEEIREQCINFVEGWK